VEEKKERTNKKLAFSSKTAEDGRPLFLRYHGSRNTCPAGETTSIKFSSPYPLAKIDQIEIVNSEACDEVSFRVLDTPIGTYTGVPEYQLNQFGFDVVVPKDYYVKTNPYDSDVFQGLQLVVDYKNNGQTKTIGVNYRLHEVKG
jgi:hypothetical protein